MSIQYRVLCDDKILLDQDTPGCELVESELTEEINDGMFDGTLRMKLFADHPNFNAVQLMKSTITAYEIHDGKEREKFRGRAVSIDDALDAQKEITCESELKFLLDVPDIFSQKAGGETRYFIGTEDGFQKEYMTEIPPLGDTIPVRLNWRAPVITGNRYEPCQLSRFGERTIYGRKAVWRSQVLTDSAMFEDIETTKKYGGRTQDDQLEWGRRHGLQSGQAGNSRYTDYWLNSVEMQYPGGIFTVEWEADDGSIHVYKIPLQRFTYKFRYMDLWGSPWDRVYLDGSKDKLGNIIHVFTDEIASGLFLGNFGLIYDDGIVASSDQWVVTTDFVADLPVTRDDEEIPLSEVPFCIAHYGSAIHWWAYGARNDGTPARYYTHNMPEDILYAVPETEPGAGNPVNRAFCRLRLSHDGGTNAGDMLRAMFALPDKRWRYHKAVPDESAALNGDLYLRAVGTLPKTEELDASIYFSALYDPRVTYYTPSGASGYAVANPQPDAAGILAAYQRGEPYFAGVLGIGGWGQYYVAVPYSPTLYPYTKVIYYSRENDETGYNAYAADDRKIYRGQIGVHGEVSGSGVQSCYASIQAILSETGGYAKITQQGEHRVIDITEDSGEISDDFYVELGQNVVDAKMTQSCDGIVTGIFPVGTWTEEETEKKSGDSDEDEDYGTNEKNYALYLYELNAEEAPSPFDMTDASIKYEYTGAGESWTDWGQVSPVYYRYSGEWIICEPTEEEWAGNVYYAPTSGDRVNKNFLYMIGGDLYHYDNNEWTIYIPSGTAPAAACVPDIGHMTDITKYYRRGGTVYRFAGAWTACVRTDSSEANAFRNIYPTTSWSASGKTSGLWYYVVGGSMKQYLTLSSGGSVESHLLPQLPKSSSATEASSIKQFTNKNYVYYLTKDNGIFFNGRIYQWESGTQRWVEYAESKTQNVPEGFELDKKLGVLWHKAARERYGDIIGYAEIGVKHVPKGIRLQYLINRGAEELKKLLTAFESLELSVVDPRLIGLEGGTPVLGNYYRTTLPWLGVDDYKRLTKIVTNMVNPDSSKISLGQKQNTLSDYVAKKGERL